jgi:hypothetical protein
MNPNDATTETPQQQTAPAATDTQAIGQFPFWYVPGVTIFTSVKAIATVSPGQLVVTDATSGQELYRYNLTSDINISTFGGYAKIKFLNGNKIGSMDRKYQFFFYNPKMQLISVLFIFSRLAISKAFVEACKKAAGQTS